MKTSKSKWFAPYLNDKAQIPTTLKSGVYLIKNKDNKIVYIGFSNSQLYKTILRHFQKWEDKQYRATYERATHKIRVIICSPSKAADLEVFLINKFNPSDNFMKYKGFSKKIMKSALETLSEAQKNDYPF